MEERRRIGERASGLTGAKGRIPPGNPRLRGMAVLLGRIPFVRDSLSQQADLGALRARPTPRVWAGLGLIALSYTIGWPAVGLLAWISYHLREPLIVAIGGPVTYGLSHLVFWIGSYFAGGPYARILLCWATRRLLTRLTGGAVPEAVLSCTAVPLLRDKADDSSGGDGTGPTPEEGVAGASRTINDPADGFGPGTAPSPAVIAGTIALLLAGLLLFVGPASAVVPLGLFIFLCLVAPFRPEVGFFLPVIHRGKGNRRAVALTFDDGPDPDVTPRLLALLGRHGVPATFFVTGLRAERYPELIRETLLLGHSLGNHSYRHDPLLMLRSAKTLREEVALTQEALSAFAVRPLIFRPPVGITNSRLPGVLGELGMCCVTFSCRAFDRGNRRIAGLARKILGKVQPGDIVLLHDITPRGGGTVDQWLAQTELILTGLKDRGYELLSLPELIGRPVMESLPTGQPIPGGGFGTR